MRITRLLLGDQLGCRVTFPLWDLLICVAVYTEDDPELGAYRGWEKRNEGLYLQLPAARGRHSVPEGHRFKWLFRISIGIQINIQH